MKLQTYLEANGLTPTQFAELVGVRSSTIWRIVNGQRGAGAQLIWDISKATNGEVTLADFVDAETMSKRRRKASQEAVQ